MASKGKSFKEYLATFKKQFKQLKTERVLPAAPDLGGPPGGAELEARRKVHTTWLLNVEGLPPEAHRILCATALFAPDGIPKEALITLANRCEGGDDVAAAGASDGSDSDSSVGSTLAFEELVLGCLVNETSLLSFRPTEAGDAFSMHRMVRMFVLESTAEEQNAGNTASNDALAALREVAERRCRSVRADYWRRSTSESEFGRVLLPHVLAALKSSKGHCDAGVAADMLSFAAGQCSHSSAYDIAKMRADKSLQLRLGKGDTAGVAASQHQMGILLEKMGDIDGALGQYNSALEMRRRLYNNADHSDIAASLHAIGNALHCKGDFDKALKEHKLSLDMSMRIHEEGGDHADVAWSLHAIGKGLYRKGDFDGALEKLNESLGMQKRIHGGSNHTDVAASLHQIGTVMFKENDSDGAPIKYKENLEIRKRIHGADADHYRIGRLMTAIGRTLCSNGDNAGAIEQLHCAQEMLDRVCVGSAHHAESLYQLGKAYLCKGDFSAALENGSKS